MKVTITSKRRDIPPEEMAVIIESVILIEELPQLITIRYTSPLFGHLTASIIQKSDMLSMLVIP